MYSYKIELKSLRFSIKILNLDIFLKVLKEIDLREWNTKI